MQLRKRRKIDSLHNLLANYALGGSKNNVILSLLNANNAGSINRMFQILVGDVLIVDNIFG